MAFLRKTTSLCVVLGMMVLLHSFHVAGAAESETIFECIATAKYNLDTAHGTTYVGRFTLDSSMKFVLKGSVWQQAENEKKKKKYEQKSSFTRTLSSPIIDAAPDAQIPVITLSMQLTQCLPNTECGPRELLEKMSLKITPVEDKKSGVKATADVQWIGHLHPSGCAVKKLDLEKLKKK